MAKRPQLLSLLTHLARLDGDMETQFPLPVPYREPFTVEFFAPGRPRAKDRGTPRPCAGGKGAYIFTSQAVQDKEKYIREEFLRHVQTYYRDYARFLPITEGWCLAAGSMVQTQDGEVPIQHLSSTDMLLTREGWRHLQHVTYMGDKHTLRLHLSNGRNLVVTPDHRILTTRGWVAAGLLTPGALLVSLAPDSIAFPAFTTSSSRFSHGVDSIASRIRVPLRAVGGGSKGRYSPTPASIFRDSDSLQVFRVAAQRVEAQMIDRVSSWYLPHHRNIGESMSSLVGVGFTTKPTFEASGYSNFATLPKPTAIGINNGIAHKKCSIYNPAWSGHHTTSVVSIHDNTILPVYDAGVNGCHEFQAEGVVVHNCWFEVYSLMPPPADWYPGLPHTGPPDGDNLYKLVKDALSGRASGRPPLAFRDDSMSAGAFPQWKCYWDETLRDTPGYPPCPGTHVAIHYEITPRNPELLPEGTAVCKLCGSDKFKTLAGLAIHERRCKNGSIESGI